MEYGYIRVSSRDQNIERQLLCMQELVSNKKNIFIDRQSGKNFDRPAYKRLLKKLKSGDVLFIKSIDRLGRNYDEILEQWRMITKVKQADIYVVDFPLLDTRKKGDNGLTGVFIADLVLQILSYVAQTEREFIHQRQAEGIAAAKLRGQQMGRPSVALPDNFYGTALRCKKGEISIAVGAKECNMNRSTFYKYLRQIDENI